MLYLFSSLPDLKTLRACLCVSRNEAQNVHSRTHVEWWQTERNLSTRRKKLSPCHPVHQKSHITDLKLNTGVYGDRSETNPLNPVTVPSLRNVAYIRSGIRTHWPSAWNMTCLTTRSHCDRLLHCCSTYGTRQRATWLARPRKWHPSLMFHTIWKLQQELIQWLTVTWTRVTVFNWVWAWMADKMIGRTQDARS